MKKKVGKTTKSKHKKNEEVKPQNKEVLLKQIESGTSDGEVDSLRISHMKEMSPEKSDSSFRLDF